ncbi:AMP-binding enzyme family protein [Mycobacterium kansasii 824]|nr:AMP-binding enzyme family protein [Mycobacterium kansasii 824]
MTDDPRTVPAALDRLAGMFPDHDVLITDDRSFTATTLRAEVHRAASALIALGVEPGDRVAIWSPNTWHWVVACLAIHHAGAAMVPLNTRYTAEEAGDILSRTRAPVLFAMGRFLGADRVAGLDLNSQALPALRHIVRIPIEADDPVRGTWDEFIAQGTDTQAVELRAAAVTPNDVSDILFTSGTTGRSKGVLCAHRQSLAASASWAANGKITGDDRYLCINPFFHNFGYKAGILACLQTGATLIPHLTFDPLRTLQAIEQHRITVLPGPPTIYQTLLDHPARAQLRPDLAAVRGDRRGHRAGGAGGTHAVRTRHRHRVDRLRPDRGQRHGNDVPPDDDAVTVATTCGRPFAGFELRIDAETGSETGEVLLRGPNVMLGYLDDPEATATAIDSDGWLHTGDIGAVDEAGNLRITDRLKDMYICGGFNVYPAEVEQVLARLDGVADAAVIGVPDQRLGEVGRAFVVPRPGPTSTKRR